MDITQPLLEIKDSTGENILRARKLALLGSVLYPVWYYVHYMVDTSIVDSLAERFVVAGIMLLTFCLSFVQKKSEIINLRMLQINRWTLITHYFSLVARNDIAIQYSVCSYFLVFMISMLFTTRKNFAIYSVYIFSMTLLCGDGRPEFPGYLFDIGMATCLAICYLALTSKFRLIESLKSREEIFRSMFDNSLIGMMTIDLKGKVMMVNETMLEMIDRKKEEIIGNHASHWVIETDKAHVDEAIGIFLKSKQQKLGIEYRFEKSDGSTVWVKVSGSVLRSGNDVKFAFLVCENITLKMEAEKVIKVQQQSMIHSSKMTALGEMSGRLAHEINTPLAVITMSAYNVRQLKKKNNLTDRALETSLEDIIATVERISKIILGLRKFSRDASKLENEVVALKDVIQDSLSLCRETFMSNKIDLKVDAIPAYLYVKCRPIELSQVLINLLNNSRDSIKNLDDKWVEINISQDAEYTIIKVSDCGTPLSQDIQTKIFQPFFTTKPVGEGTGLGLSISIGIIQSFGGVLEYDTKSSHCSFLIKLPKIASNDKKMAS